MRIEKVESGYTEIVNIGRHCLFIYLDEKGVEEKYEDLVEQAMHFNRVIISGDEPFLQKEEVSKFTKRLLRKNDNVVVEFFTKGIIKPLSVGGFNRIIYNVFLELKNKNKTYEERIKPGVINWFNLSDSNFIFEVESEDDVDEVVLLLQDVGIQKHRVFLCPKTNQKLIFEKCKTYSFNFAPWVKLNDT